MSLLLYVHHITESQTAASLHGLVQHGDCSMHVAQKLKHKLYDILESGSGSKADDYFLSTLILLNVVAAIVETLTGLRSYASFFRTFELASIVVFTTEYLLRIWVITCNPLYSHPVKGRLRYIISPLSLIDLLAIMPFYLPFLGLDLRILRLMRLLRIFKLARYSSALQVIGNVFARKRDELLLTLFVMFVLLIFSSSVVYYVENEAQPDTFSSIPAAMWWGIATVTTVGYGDIYPVTPLGKFFTAFIALLGVGLLALPTGILSDGFSEERNSVSGEKELAITQAQCCPHCGKELVLHVSVQKPPPLQQNISADETSAGG